MQRSAKNSIIYAFMNAYSQGKSGGDVTFIEFLKTLPKHKVVFVTSLLGVRLLKKLGLNTSFYITSTEKRFINPYFLYIKRTIKALLISFPKKPYLMLSSSDFFPDVIPPFVMKNSNNKWIQTIHHFYPHYHLRQGNKLTNFIAFYSQKFSFFLIKKRADRIITVNNLVKNDLIKIGFDKNKIVICPNGVNIEGIKKIKKDHMHYDGIFLGRIHESKGVFDLITIWEYVCQKSPKATLALIGVDSLGIKNRLIEVVKKRGLQNNIKILGYLDSKKTFALMKSSKLFVSASHEEGFGIALAEAMVCGIPVISWNLQVYQEIFTNHTIQVKEYDYKAFADAVITLLNNSKKREQIATSGLRYIKKYALQTVCARYYKLLTFS